MAPTFLRGRPTSELDVVLSDREAIPAFQDISVDQVELSDDDRYFLFGFGAAHWDAGSPTSATGSQAGPRRPCAGCGEGARW